MFSRTKKEHHPIGWCSFLVMGKRLEEGGGSCKTSVKKCPVDTFLARGRVLSKTDGIRCGCGQDLIRPCLRNYKNSADLFRGFFTSSFFLSAEEFLGGNK